MPASLQLQILRGGAGAAREAHNLEVVGANPTPATSCPTSRLLSSRIGAQSRSLIQQRLAGSFLRASSRRAVNNTPWFWKMLLPWLARFFFFHRWQDKPPRNQRTHRLAFWLFTNGAMQ